jgi:4-amino-4-deoxy-L-arabinose transferase-like glycosyltransferase
MQKLQSRKWILIVLLIVAFYFPVFLKLDSQVLREWDEPRNAINAVEMYQNHNFITRFFDGEPDMWEVKPPFLVWLQVLSMKIFGINELAVRFPSAFATFCLLFFLVYYFYKSQSAPVIGIYSAFILVTSLGYMGWHVSRTGDHDSLLSLFMLLYVLAFYSLLYENDPKKKIRKTYLFFFFLFLAFFTKSVASLMFLPALGIFALITQKTKIIFTQKHTYIALFTFILLAFLYYYFRELHSPGYLQIVWNEEWFPRYFNANKAFKEEPILYYYNNMREYRFYPWILFLIPSFVLQFFTVPKVYKSFYGYISLCIFFFLAIISKGSKNFWYDAPAYPLMAIHIAGVFYFTSLKLLSGFKLNLKWSQTILMVLIPFIFYIPYRKVVSQNINQLENTNGVSYYAIPYVLREMQESKLNLQTPLHIVYENYTGHILFYVKALEVEKGIKDISFKSKENIIQGDRIIVSQSHVEEFLKENFETHKIHSAHGANVYEIIGKIPIFPKKD